MVNGVANAIHVDGTNHLQLAAAQGKEVRFNDPITSAAYFSSTENVTLSLNQYTDDDGISHATDGTVIFSGELYQGMTPTSWPAATAISRAKPPSTAVSSSWNTMSSSAMPACGTIPP